jgi:hypothetical protein
MVSPWKMRIWKKVSMRRILSAWMEEVSSSTGSGGPCVEKIFKILEDLYRIPTLVSWVKVFRCTVYVIPVFRIRDILKKHRITDQQHRKIA